MKVEELLAQSYYESHEAQIKELILSAYKEGYNHGLKKSHEIKIDRVTYIDLGLPSGTLWSNPMYIIPPGCNYRNYDMCSYSEVCELALPTQEDFEELLHHCKFSFYDNPSKSVQVTAPNGQRILIETQDHLNRPENRMSHLRVRKGEKVPAGTNMFWLKSEVKDNEAKVVVVDTNDNRLDYSTHFVGYKLPYLLVKK